MPEVSLEKVISGYELEVLGEKVTIEPFTFNEININDDILVRPQLYVKDRELFESLVND
jgi:hypothetical protein